jgi:CubicO group peptidase (beta-lactamase class C family)
MTGTLTDVGRLVERFRAGHRIPGVAVCLFDRDGPIATHTAGRLSVELPDAPLTTDARFCVYSVAKHLTALLACRLHATGEVDLDAPIRQYLPELRLRGGTDPDPLALRHLLSNSAGFVPDRTEHDGSGRNTGDLEPEVLAEVARMPLLGPPGRFYAYSNAGMSLAGLILQRATGQPFATLVKDRLLDPLGMAATTYDPALAMTYPLAQHHVADPHGAIAVLHRAKAGVRHQPAGMCWTTVTDLARLGAAELGDDPAWSAAHRVSVPIPVDTGLGYGLGTLVTRRGGSACVGHEGFHPGMWCKLLILPEHGLGLVWADNRGPELRTARYRVIDTILANFGVAGTDPADDRPGITRLSVEAVSGRYRRFGAEPVEVRSADADALLVCSAGQRVRLARATGTIWAATPPPDLAASPPWVPHMDSTRVCAGFQIGPDGATHLYLNGLPYRGAN